MHGLAQDRAQPGNRGTESVRWRRRVTHDQGRAELLLPAPAAAQPLERESAARAACHDVRLGQASRQANEHVQACGDAGDLDSGDFARERADEPVAALTVGEPGAPDLPVVGPPDLMNSAKASWSRLLLHRPATRLRSATSAARPPGRASQPSRSPGTRLLLAVPA